MAYGDERDNSGLTPMTNGTPRTGGNPQGISDSVATPPNGGTQEGRSGGVRPASALKPTETATGGILSRLASVPAAAQAAPSLASLTPNAPAATQATTQGTAAQAPFSPAPNQGLVQSYFDKLTGKAPQDAARTEQYRQMFEAARRGAARNPADGYNAQREQALKTAMGQAVRQNVAQGQSPAQTVPSGISAPVVRQNADGTKTTVGMVNGEEIDYGSASPSDAAAMQDVLVGTQGIIDEFYGNDLDFMTNA